MEGEFVGTHKGCGGRVHERVLLRGKHRTNSFHWICNTCGKQPESKDIKESSQRLSRGTKESIEKLYDDGLITKAERDNEVAMVMYQG